MLYFHLALNADDDGVVEAFPVIRMVGSNEDDFKILVAKFFITILNDDLVSFVNDWTEHNLIRPDRKVDSKYKNLLIQKIENIKLIDSKPRADRLGRPMDVQCQDMAGEMSAQVRLGKVRLGKVSNPTNVGLSKKPKSTANIEQYVEELKAKYPDKNVEAELNKASEWLNATGKVYKNYGAFYNLWLQRSDNKANGFNERKVYDVSHIK